MKVAVDTNVLVRMAVWDDPAQAQKAVDLVAAADAVVVSLPCICEFVWVLERVYRLPRDKIELSVVTLLENAKVLMDEGAVQAGLQVLRSGGDFADGVIVATGMAMGASNFVSFDREAVARVKALGLSAQDLNVQP